MILERLPGSRFSRVLPLWKGKTVVLIGGGESLTVAQVEAARTSDVRCIAVNNGYLMAPWADVCYFADSHWWVWNHEGRVPSPNGSSRPYECAGLSSDEIREKFRAFAGQKCSIQNSGANIKDPAVHILKNKTYPHQADGLSLDPQALITGRNSGFQALNMAALSGAKKILLLGYDGKPGARTHWFGEHPRPTPAAAFPYYLQSFSAAESELKRIGVEVINCSPGSAIDSFPKMSIEQALCS